MTFRKLAGAILGTSNAVTPRLFRLSATLDANRQKGRLREVARVRELLVDFSEGTQVYKSSEDSWRKYFMAFVRAARRNR